MTQDFVEYGDFWGEGGGSSVTGLTAVGAAPDVMQSILRHVDPGNISLSDFEDPYNVLVVIFDEDTVDYFERSYHEYTELIERHSVGAELDFDLMIREGSGWATGETVTLRIIGLVRAGDIPPYIGVGYFLPSLYMPRESFTKLGWDETYKQLVLNVDENKHDDVLRAIEALCAHEPELNIESFRQYRDEMTSVLTGIIIVSQLMLVVIALNGIMNLIGTTFMGIEQRKKELGVLMAVGLSRKAIDKLLTREGIWVSLFSAALSVVFGLAIGIGLYHLMYSAGANYLEFIFPFWPLFSLCIVLGFVPYLITQLAARRLQKSTIVELLGRQV